MSSKFKKDVRSLSIDNIPMVSSLSRVNFDINLVLILFSTENNLSLLQLVHEIDKNINVWKCLQYV